MHGTRDSLQLEHHDWLGGQIEREGLIEFSC